MQCEEVVQAGTQYSLRIRLRMPLMTEVNTQSLLGGFFQFSIEIIALLYVSPEHFRQRVMHAHICVSH
jgi:hypothetical protein